MNIQEIILNLQCNLDLMQFDPFTGETIAKSCMNKLNRELCTALEEAIKELQKKSWISVKDRLPEDGESILIFVNDSRYEPIQYDVCYYDGDDAWLDSGYSFGSDVTHWMPLPEPPEMKGE